MVTLTDFLPSAGLKKVTAKELAGPCPRCGGVDRFRVWPDRPRGGAYLCRGCGAKGDGIQFLRDFKRMSYREALASLEIVPHERRKPYDASKSRTMLFCASQHETTKLLPLPCEKWRNAAARFFESCKRDMWLPESVVALTGRYLPPETAVECGISYNRRERYELRSVWGLPPVEGKHDGGKVKLPRGIIICSMRDGEIVSITVRQPDDRPKGEKKYRQVAGGSDAPYVVGQAGQPLMLVESGLDAALLWSESGGSVSAVALNGAGKRPDEWTDKFIRQAPILVASPDADEAGRSAWKHWRRWYPHVVAYPAAGGQKDLGDMHKAAFQWPIPADAITVMDWLPKALSYAKRRTASSLQDKTGVAA